MREENGKRGGGIQFHRLKKGNSMEEEAQRETRWNDQRLVESPLEVPGLSVQGSPRSAFVRTSESE